MMLFGNHNVPGLMNYFDENSMRFRLWLTALLVCVTTITVYNFIRFTSSPTDENWFTDAPVRFYVTRSVPAQFVHVKSGRAFGKPLQVVADSILVGDLIVSGYSKKGMAKGSHGNSVAMPDSGETVQVIRPQYNQSIAYRLTQRITSPFYKPSPSSVFIFDVIPGGASDRAGMKPGDLLLEINGKTFTNAAGADLILRSGQSGKSIDYKVLRQNETLVLHVTLARWGISFSLLCIVLTGLIYMAVGFFLGYKRPQLAAARLLGLGFVLLGYIMTVAPIRRDSGFDIMVLIRDITLPVAGFFGTATLTHAFLHFPKPSPALLARRWLTWLPYVMATTALGLTWMFGERFINLFLLIMIAVLMAVKMLYRREANPENKRLARILAWAAFVVVIVLLLLSGLFARFGKPFQSGFIGLPLIIFPLALLYTIGRYRLLDMNIRIRRNIRYSIIYTLWISLLLALGLLLVWTLPKLTLNLPNFQITGASLEIVDSPASAVQKTTLEKGVLMVVAMLVLAVIWKTGRMGIRFLDRRFHRDHYDYRQASDLLSGVLHQPVGPSDLARTLVSGIGDLMHVRQVGLLLRHEDPRLAHGDVTGVSLADWNAFTDRTTEILAALQPKLSGDEPLTVDYFPDAIRRDIFQLGFRHVIPVRSQSRLLAVLFIGEKLSETPFYQEDFHFLQAMARQAAVSLENAFLYAELAQRERLNREMEIARHIQLASLPQAVPEWPGLQLAGTSLPAQEVGGDYYDFLNSQAQRLMVVVGDVSGKGISAALYMSKMQGILRSLYDFNLSPSELFLRLNEILSRDMNKNFFVTALAADIQPDRRQVLVARAGHLPLFHYRRHSDQVHVLTPRGIGFGLDQNGLFGKELEVMAVPYEVGDVFLFVTDGITEARNLQEQEFGESRLQQLLQTNAHASADDLCKQILRQVHDYSARQTPLDDQTVVVIKAV